MNGAARAHRGLLLCGGACECGRLGRRLENGGRREAGDELADGAVGRGGSGGRAGGAKAQAGGPGGD